MLAQKAEDQMLLNLLTRYKAALDREIDTAVKTAGVDFEVGAEYLSVSAIIDELNKADQRGESICCFLLESIKSEWTWAKGAEKLIHNAVEWQNRSIKFERQIQDIRLNECAILNQTFCLKTLSLDGNLEKF